MFFLVLRSQNDNFHFVGCILIKFRPKDGIFLELKIDTFMKKVKNTVEYTSESKSSNKSCNTLETGPANGIVYFTSNRPGGFGGLDLYSAEQLGPNTWAPAVNLGPRVNTSSADMCPALPPGAGTLTWFSDRSDSSFGAFDIFWTNKTNLTTTP